MYDSESCLENILTELIELRRHASVISRQGLPTRQACENKGKSKTKYFFAGFHSFPNLLLLSKHKVLYKTRYKF